MNAAQATMCSQGGAKPLPMDEAFLDGNRASAEAARRCRVQVVSAYPITPQTHAVETLAEFIADGTLDAEMVRVESEHSAMSAAAGAAVVGARCFTASCSQGLALMAEVLHFVSGMRFPVVMAVANRTLSSPVNIWVDHQDSMVMRDAGWIQLYAATAQEVFDLVCMAYRICERGDISLPAMVCHDGFIVSHVSEPVRMLPQERLDAFLPELGNPQRPVMDVAAPQQFGEVLFPPWYPAYEKKRHDAMMSAAGAFSDAATRWSALGGERHKAVETYRVEDADVVLVGVASHMLTACHAVDELRQQGEKVGVARIKCFRPFPTDALRAVLARAQVAAVLDRAVGYGETGPVFADLAAAFVNRPSAPHLVDLIVGLGGKDITPETIHRCVRLSRDAADAGETRVVLWPDA